MTGSSDALRALEDAALASADRGDTESAAALATELLRQDPGNGIARRVLAQSEVEPPGELRRLTVLFSDLVGSTSLSARHDPDVYHRVLQRYHRMCSGVIAAHGGTVNQRVGDGVLAVFGHPISHEDDTRRAVRAGLDLAARVEATRGETEREIGESLEVRVAIHLGPVHLDLLDSGIYGLAPNIAARLQDLASPGTVVCSDEVIEVVGGFFETHAHDPHSVKGVDALVGYHTIVRELPYTSERGRTWHTPFVGRQGARDQLRVALEQGVPAAIRGESGIGKSRLVAEVLGELTIAPSRLTTIICTEYEQTSDFGVTGAVLRLDQSVAGAPGPVERLEQLTEDLSLLGLDPDTHTGLLAPLLGLEPSLGYDRPAADLTRVHDQVLASLRAWLQALATRDPMVLLAEDVHWADASTRELLQDLVSNPIGGLRLVATERSDNVSSWGSRVTVIELAPLLHDESAQLALAIDDNIGGDRLETILVRGQGNPLFIEELAREPASLNTVDPELLSRFMNESGVPGALYEPLLSRLYSSGADVGLAQAAATIGRGFSRSVLAAVMPRPPEVLDSGIRSLLDAGLLDEEEDGLYWFRHALIRDVAYDLQPREQRIAMHRRVGDALRAQRTGGADISSSVIANHYQAAGRIDDAIEAYAAAADESRQRGSMQVGIAHLTTAIDLIGPRAGLDADLRRREIDLRLKRGFLCVSSGGNADPRAVADYERCLELIRAEENGPELVSTLVVLWGYHAARGDLARADGLLDEIMATGITDDPAMLAENRTARGLVRFFQGDFASSADLLRLALDGLPDARPLSPWEFPNDAVTFMHVQYGLARWQRGDVAGFRDAAGRAGQRASGLPRPHGPFNLCYARSYEAWVLTEIGEYEDAAARVAELLDLADTYGFDFWTLAGNFADAILRGRASLASGAVDTDLLLDQSNRLRGAATMTQMIDSKLLLPYGFTAQAEFAAVAGDHDEAMELFDQALAVADETGSQFYRAETHRLRARTRSVLGDLSAVDDLHTAIDLAARQGSIPFELRARLDLAEVGQRSPRLDELLADRTSLVAAGVGDLGLRPSTA